MNHYKIPIQEEKTIAGRQCGKVALKDGLQYAEKVGNVTVRMVLGITSATAAENVHELCTKARSFRFLAPRLLDVARTLYWRCSVRGQVLLAVLELRLRRALWWSKFAFAHSLCCIWMPVLALLNLPWASSGLASSRSGLWEIGV